jgi:hypothetical protein
MRSRFIAGRDELIDDDPEHRWRANCASQHASAGSAAGSRIQIRAPLLREQRVDDAIPLASRMWFSGT